MRFGRVSDTPYCNFSLLYVLLLDVFCSTPWNLLKYTLLSPVAIPYCMLTVRDYISMRFMRYSLQNCLFFWVHQLLLCLKYFLWDITYNVEYCWGLAVLYVMARFSVWIYPYRIFQLYLTDSCIFEYQLRILCKVLLTIKVTPKY